MSTSIKNIVNTLGAIDTEFGLDLLDLQILYAADTRWQENRDIRMIDLVHEFRVASSATVHTRVTRQLVDKGMIQLKANPDDLREKFVVPGKKFKTLKKFLGE
jgi:DNA-binding MarR family transcriptional regulator